jgi:hypothetical protein
VLPCDRIDRLVQLGIGAAIGRRSAPIGGGGRSRPYVKSMTYGGGR